MAERGFHRSPENFAELYPRSNPELVPAEPSVVGIYTCLDKGQPMDFNSEVTAIQGKGLIGQNGPDRYLSGQGAYSKAKPTKIRDVTLISLEDIEGTDFAPEETRRNIVVEGIDLNTFLGEVIRVGDVDIEVTELCEPCDRPSRLSEKPAFKSVFENKGGVRGRILTDGKIRVGDSIQIQVN